MGAAEVSFRSVFLGPPGAGKGTQAHTVAAGPGVLHLSTGDMLRSHVAQGTELGAQAKGFMDAGQLVPDALIIAMVEDQLASNEESGSWILDGFPRTIPQAEALDQSLQSANAPLTHVVYFRVPNEALIQRLTGRRTCGDCGAIWNVHTHPTQTEGTCDACGGALTQRSDDRPEAVAQRLEAYDKQTKPLLDFYRSKGCLVEIDADRSPDEVSKELSDALAKEVC